MQQKRGGATTPRAPREPKTPIPREIWVLVSAAFVIALGFGLIAPILPQYARSFDVSVFAASFVVSSFSIFRLIFFSLSLSADAVGICARV